VDHPLDKLTVAGTLQKLSQGLYYFPKQSDFSKTPPDDAELVQSFLKLKNVEDNIRTMDTRKLQAAEGNPEM
jgi:hypothetical protein